MKNAVLLAKTPLFLTAGLFAITVATWSCTHDSGKGGTGGSGGQGGQGGQVGTGGADGGSCWDPTAPTPPEKACDPKKDVSTECPLPDTVSVDDDLDTTVYYYSNPYCSFGKCHYCVTSTTSEDPNATGAP